MQVDAYPLIEEPETPVEEQVQTVDKKTKRGGNNNNSSSSNNNTNKKKNGAGKRQQQQQNSSSDGADPGAAQGEGEGEAAASGPVVKKAPRSRKPQTSTYTREQVVALPIAEFIALGDEEKKRCITTLVGTSGVAAFMFNADKRANPAFEKLNYSDLTDEQKKEYVRRAAAMTDARSAKLDSLKAEREELYNEIVAFETNRKKSGGKKNRGGKKGLSATLFKSFATSYGVDRALEAFVGAREETKVALTRISDSLVTKFFHMKDANGKRIAMPASICSYLSELSLPAGIDTTIESFSSLNAAPGVGGEEEEEEEHQQQQDQQARGE